MIRQLNHLTSDILSEILISFGVGSRVSDEDDWPVYSTHHPDEPDDLICVYNTTPELQGRIQLTGQVVEQKGVQFKVRAADKLVGEMKINQIANLVDEQVRRMLVLLGDSRYVVHSINRTGGVIFVGPEQSESFRYLFTLNAKVSVTEVPVS